jgi:hypothetical protein
MRTGLEDDEAFCTCALMYYTFLDYCIRPYAK